MFFNPSERLKGASTASQLYEQLRQIDQRKVDDPIRTRIYAVALHDLRLSKEALERLGDRITSQCDELEELGLVDYQTGVWEEEIVGSEWSAFTSEYQNIAFTDYVQWYLNVFIISPAVMAIMTIITMAMMNLPSLNRVQRRNSQFKLLTINEPLHRPCSDSRS